MVTRAQKELNIHTRRPLHKSKGTTSLSSLLPKVDSKDVEPKESMDIESVQDVVEQVSEAMKRCEVTDIDADDYENPQMCAEYANEIFRYLLKYEVQERKYFWYSTIKIDTTLIKAPNITRTD